MNYAAGTTAGLPDMTLSDNEIKVFLSLLEAGLWGRAPEDLTPFPLGRESWDRILYMSMRQTVTGIVYDGLHSLPDSFLPPVDLLVKWTAEVDSIERKNVGMNRVLAELYTLFRQHGFSTVLQKGQGVALMYSRPLMRECGDIDFCFSTGEELREAALLMESLGCRTETLPDGSVFYRWKDVAVEHHDRLIDLHSPFLRKYIRSLIDEYGFSEVTLPAGQGLSGCSSAGSPSVDREAGDGDGVILTVPSPMLNLLMLNSHVLKHAVGLGIGMRQICDMAVACARLHGSIDPGEMLRMERRTGIAGWSRALYSFMVHYTGLDPELLPHAGEDRRSAAALLEMVLKGGNFGHVRRRGVPSPRTGQRRPGTAGEHPGTTSHGTGRGLWRRKLETMSSFIAHSSFSMKVAPAETFWTFTALAAGQILHRR